LLQESRCKVRLKADPTAEKVLQDNANITFNPATGAPYPFSNRATRAFPMWGVVGQQMFTGWSNYHGLQSVFTKRFTHRWQGSLTYTLSGLRDGDPAPLSGIKQVSFPVAPDFGASMASRSPINAIVWCPTASGRLWAACDRSPQ
jgi:hypothetical protein